MSETLRDRARVVLSVLLVVGLLVGMRQFSLAVFTDTATVTGNVFTMGDLDISTSPTVALVTDPTMAPGDEQTGALTVTNEGSMELRYAVTSTVSNDEALARQLDLTVKAGVSDCTTGGFDADGTVVYGPGDLGSAAGLAILGDPAQGQQAGDRTLASGGGETLCLNVALPLSTDETFSDQTTTADFAFVAEQTANNP